MLVRFSNSLAPVLSSDLVAIVELNTESPTRVCSVADSFDTDASWVDSPSLVVISVGLDPAPNKPNGEGKEVWMGSSADDPVKEIFWVSFRSLDWLPNEPKGEGGEVLMGSSADDPVDEIFWRLFINLDGLN